MKHFSKILCLSLIAFLFIGISDAEAQRSKKRSSKNDEYFDESGDIKHRLWYGGGFNLNFQGTNLGGIGGNIFRVGISPMVGYKILPNVSIGPRAELSYTTGRFDAGGGDILKYNTLDVGIGPFMRFKPLPALFAHVEFQYFSQQVATALDFQADKIVTERQGQENFFIGAGYASPAGGPWGYEVSILYNVLEADNSVNLPIYFRFGFTYNFF